jgi:lactoylglutathione lyase
MDSMLTIVYVSDMGRSVRFYRDVLELHLEFESPEWSEFSVGAARLALHGGATPKPSMPARKETSAATATIALTVANVDQVVTQLKSRGARFVMEPADREGEGIRLAVLLDPDGLAVSLVEKRQG